MVCLLAASPAAYATPPRASGVTRADTLSTISVTVKNSGAFQVKFCLKTSTTMLRPRGSDRSCTDGWILAEQSRVLTADVSGHLDDMYLDTEVDEFTGTKTIDDKWITGAKNCDVSGVTIAIKVNCDTPSAAAVVITPPSVAAFAIDVSNPGDPAMSLLSLLAWLVTAAAVAGLLITGMNMALQLRRGDPGEFSEHWRGFIFVATACLIGATAGPIVAFLAVA